MGDITAATIERTVGQQLVFGREAAPEDDPDFFAHAAAIAEHQAAVARGAKLSPRKLPLDAIFTLAATDPAIFVALDAGFLIGCNSGHATMKAAVVHRWQWKFDLAFVDNPYHDYDHAHHAEVIHRLKPKYATVRDVMSEEQCAAAGIPYYSFDQIMRWAEELNTSAANVIVIPKIDCLHEIPDRFMLGYSVPTSYGGTPLPASRFAGRRVHLLGGSWKNQLAFLRILGDSVVSIDFNHVNNIARFGTFNRPDGREDENLRDGLGLSVTNARLVSIAISLGHIGRALYNLTGEARYKGELDTATIAAVPDVDVLVPAFGPLPIAEGSVAAQDATIRPDPDVSVESPQIRSDALTATTEQPVPTIGGAPTEVGAEICSPAPEPAPEPIAPVPTPPLTWGVQLDARTDGKSRKGTKPKRDTNDLQTLPMFDTM